MSKINSNSSSNNNNNASKPKELKTSSTTANTLACPSASKILGIVLLKMNGERIYSQYYTRAFAVSKSIVNSNDLSQFDGQRSFEQEISKKAIKLKIKDMKPSQTEVFTFFNLSVIFKKLNDCLLFVFSDNDENELLLAQILETFLECLNHFTQENLSVETITSAYDQIILAIDEMIHEGIVVNLESNTILARALMIDTDTMIVQRPDDKAFASVFDMAKGKIKKQLNF